MTATEQAATEAAPGPAGGPRAWWTAHRGPVLLALLVVVVAALGTIGLKPGAAEPLAPDSPAPKGTLALVRILRAQGVQVDVVRRAGSLHPTPDSTLLITRPQLAPYHLLEELSGRVDVVLVQPDAVTLGALGAAIEPRGTAPDSWADPGCTLAHAVAAGRTRAGGAQYATGRADAAAPAEICYPPTDQASSGQGSLAIQQVDGTKVVALGQPQVLTNEYLATEGNAALALRLLGAHPKLLWYIPDPLDLPVGDAEPDPISLMPRWVFWVPLQLTVAAVLAMLWRGRRLGRLVPEPLPVVVRAAETQEGRARLYRQAGARDRAAATLRTATMRRLARRFAVTESGPDALIDRVLTVVDRDPAATRATLLGPPPASDAALVRLADELDAIEHDVHHPGRAPAGSAPAIQDR